MMPWWLHCALSVSPVGVHERDLFKCTSLLAVVVYTFDPSNQQTEAKESQVPGQPASPYLGPKEQRQIGRAHKCVSCFRQTVGARKISVYLVLFNHQLKLVDVWGQHVCCYCGTLADGHCHES